MITHFLTSDGTPAIPSGDFPSVETLKPGTIISADGKAWKVAKAPIRFDRSPGLTIASWNAVVQVQPIDAKLVGLKPPATMPDLLKKLTESAW